MNVITGILFDVPENFVKGILVGSGTGRMSVFLLDCILVGSLEVDAWYVGINEAIYHTCWMG